MLKKLFYIYLAIFIVNPVLAEVILETSTGTGGAGGTSLSDTQSYGTRFHLDQTVEVTAIGGLMGGYNPEGTLYGAIVSLNSPTAYPVTSSPATTPFDVSEVVAYTTFSVPYGARDHLFDLSVTLQQGDYALIFGSNYLGASGGWAFMPSQGLTFVPGHSEHMYWQPDNAMWLSNGLPERFLIEGAIVPEPASILLLGLGGLAMRKRAN